MTRLSRLVVVLAILAIGFAADAYADKKRVALVIGNGSYQHSAHLLNPAGDAKLIAEKLQQAGFDVIQGVDLDLAAMHALVNQFTEDAFDADIALIFYAGHGIQANGVNYMVPVDANLTTPAHLRTRTVEIDDFLKALPSDPAIGIIILDACRDNPFARSLGALSRSGGGQQGLAPLQVSSSSLGNGGILVAYATDPGQVAYDGTGAHSPYAEALAKHLVEPGVELQGALTRVRGEVTASTNGRQRPWHNASLGREVYLGGQPAKPQSFEASTPSTGTPEETDWIEQRIWDEASKRDTVEHYEAYLRRFPNGQFIDLAKLNIENLRDVRGSQLERGQLTLGDSSAVDALNEMNGQERVDVQLRLKALGYQIGAIDGVLGKTSRRAIGEWQASHGFPVSQSLTTAQLATLKEQTASLVDAARRSLLPPTQTDKPAKQKSKVVKLSATPQTPTGPQGRQETRSKPAETQVRPRFKTCTNGYGSYDIPVNRRCSPSHTNGSIYSVQ